MATSGVTDFNLDVSEIIEESYERIGMEARSGYDARTARRSLNLLLTEWANKSITLWGMDRVVVPAVQGQARYELDNSVVDVLEVAIRTSGSDIVLTRTSRHESVYIPNKDQAGRPTQYYLDRLPDKTVIEVWPVPNAPMSFVVDLFRFTEDVSASRETVATPRRLLPAMVSGLAYHLALKKQPDKVNMMRQLYERDLQEALAADQEVQSFQVLPRSARRR